MVLFGGGVIEGLVVALGIVVSDKGGDVGSGVFDGGEGVKPDAFLFEGADEPFAEAVLLRGVPGNVLPRFARPPGSLRLAISGYASGSCMRP